MEHSSRNTVVSVRLDALSLEAMDLLVQSGLAQSRSEAAAQFIAIGIRSGEEMLRQARELAERVQAVKNEMLGAVKARDVSRVRALLDENASLVNARTEEGDSPLLTSVYYGAKEVTELLLARGAELNLFEAAALGETERVREILTADPQLTNTYSHDGWTPLHLAAFFGHAGTALYLLGEGADVRAVSHNRMANTPLHATLASRRTDIARLLLQAGADVTAVDPAGWTPLHHATYNGDEEMVPLLLQRGARIDARNGKGQTPLEVAVEKEHEGIAQMLRQHGDRA